jgi:hypothetical protein
MTDSIRPHPKNAPGPFYVVDGCCTACDVPFIESPGLFAYDSKDHCFVKRQPATKEELNRMFRAVGAAEFQCIRYRGQDPDVLRRFGELGERFLCDAPPPASVRPVFRNHVTFDAASAQVESMAPRELALAYQEYLGSPKQHWRTCEFTSIMLQEASAAFSYSWFQSNYHPMEFCDISLPDCRWLLRHSWVEKPGSRGVSYMVDDWLKNDGRFCKVRWYSEEQWHSSKEWQDTPS